MFDYILKDVVLKKCPHCGSKARIILEGYHYTSRLQRRARYARIVCSKNDPARRLEGKGRCLCKTVAAPIEEVIEHWQMRKGKK